VWIAGLRRFFRALALSSSLRNATNPLGIAGAARTPKRRSVIGRQTRPERRLLSGNILSCRPPGGLGQREDGALVLRVLPRSRVAERERLSLRRVRAAAPDYESVAEPQDLGDGVVPLVAVVDHDGVHGEANVLQSEVKIAFAL